LGENRLQTPNKRVFLHMSKSWATRVWTPKPRSPMCMWLMRTS
jgi:hypothetical protein